MPKILLVFNYHGVVKVWNYFVYNCEMTNLFSDQIVCIKCIVLEMHLYNFYFIFFFRIGLDCGFQAYRCHVTVAAWRTT